MALASLTGICLEVNFFESMLGHFLKHKKLFCIKMFKFFKVYFIKPKLDAAI